MNRRDYGPIPLDLALAGDRHPYPFKLGIQTMVFIRASLDYMTEMGLIREFFSQMPEAARMRVVLLAERGESAEFISESDKMKMYCKPYLKAALLRDSIITAVSQWDWFLRRLQEFVQWGFTQIEPPQTPSVVLKEWKKHRGAIDVQVSRYAAILGVESLEISDPALAALHELGLLRNIGVHNRWETDETYLAQSRTEGPDGPWKIGDFREISSMDWYNYTLPLQKEATWKLALAVGERFKSLGPYPDDAWPDVEASGEPTSSS